MAINKYNSMNGFEKLVGAGFGTVVPIDFAKRSRWDDEKVYHLEWLHNG